MLLHQAIERNAKDGAVKGEQRLGCETLAEALFLVSAVSSYWQSVRHDGANEPRPNAVDQQLHYLGTASIFPEDSRFLSTEDSARISSFINRAWAQVSFMPDGKRVSASELAVIGGVKVLDSEIHKVQAALPSVLHAVLPEIFPVAPYVPIGNDDSDVLSGNGINLDALRSSNGLILGDNYAGTRIPSSVVVIGSTIAEPSVRPRF